VHPSSVPSARSANQMPWPCLPHTSAYVSIRQHTSAHVQRTNCRGPGMQVLRCQYLCFCTSKASKLTTWLPHMLHAVITGFALRLISAPTEPLSSNKVLQRQLRQYLYFSTSKASNLCTAKRCRARHPSYRAPRSGCPPARTPPCCAASSCVSSCTFVPADAPVFVLLYQKRRQYWKFCTSRLDGRSCARNVTNV
jgi:hypothetical protein